MRNSASRTVGLACSGGDAPGMNAFIRAFVQIGANQRGATVLGIKDGYCGLVRLCQGIQAGKLTIETIRAEIETHAGPAGLRRRGQELVRLSQAAVRDLVGQGGTILGAGQCEPFHDGEIRQQVIDLLNGLGVEALVVLGGEGSLAGAAQLVAESCLAVVGVPATIDNDTHRYTESALGFDTALSNAVSSVERCREAAKSHGRIIVVETRGRASGQIAEAAALAAGADIAVIPERGPLTGSKVVGIARRIERARADGLSHAIVVVAEGVELPRPGPRGVGQALTDALRAYFHRPCTPVPGTEVRLCVLGNSQRGGPPTVHDRLLAAHYAEAAWDALAANPPRSGVVGLRQGQYVLQRFGERDAPVPPEPVRRGYQLQKMISRC